MLTVGTREVDWGLGMVLVVSTGPNEAGGDVDWGLTSVVIVASRYVDTFGFGVGLGSLTGG